MKYILYDCSDNELKDLIDFDYSNYSLINCKKSQAKCVGCLKCWLKHPSKCTFKDSIEELGAKLLSSEEVVFVFEPLFGGFSSSVKAYIDRMIPGIQPFFKVVNKKLHHHPRYNIKPDYKYFAYNSINLSDLEKNQLNNIVKAVSINFQANNYELKLV
ncbi:MAG: hypothetical protein ACRC5M_01055 [Anaeroplasmataceae bacterium]